MRDAICLAREFSSWHISAGPAGEAAAEWIGRLKLSARQLSTFTPFKAAVPFPASSRHVASALLRPTLRDGPA